MLHEHYKHFYGIPVILYFMRAVYTLGHGGYIDESIEDATLREIDWNISIYTLTEQWSLVLKSKWRRAMYLSAGHLDKA